jgi:hypothetical protein
MKRELQTSVYVLRIATSASDLFEAIEDPITGPLTGVKDPGLPAGGNLF